MSTAEWLDQVERCVALVLLILLAIYCLRGLK
jgi:hypothetical protein